jgi:hypothetical protein
LLVAILGIATHRVNLGKVVMVLEFFNLQIMEMVAEEGKPTVVKQVV